MPNKSCTVSTVLSYQAPDGSVRSVTKSVNCEFQSSVEGAIDVPDAQAAATVYNIPFESIAVDTRAIMIENQTGQPLKVKINGAATASHTLAPGGIQLVGEPAASGATPILSLSLETTVPQVGAGQINYWVFGDPV